MARLHAKLSGHAPARVSLAMAVALAIAAMPTCASGQAIAATRDSIDVGDCMLHYRVAGGGEQTVFILSGGPGESADYLVPVEKHLATEARAVLLDQRGTGPSKLRRTDSTTVTVHRAVEDIEAVRVRLGVRRLVLLGHSWGGALAMAYAAAHPEHVAGLVLVGAAALVGGSDSARAVGERLAQRPTLADRDSIRRWASVAATPARHQEAMAQLYRLNRKAYLYDARNDAAVERSKATTTMDPTVLRLMLRDLDRLGRDIAPTLAKAARASSPPMRALVLYGEADVIGGSSAPEIRAIIPGAEVHVIRHSGHYPWIEAPNAFYGEVDGFLAGLPR